MNLRRFAVFTLILALLHSGIIIGSELIAFGGGFNLDHPEIEPSRLQQMFGTLLSVLMQPGDMVWAALRVTPTSTVVEWSMIILNSLMWGATGALIVVLFTHHAQKPVNE